MGIKRRSRETAIAEGKKPLTTRGLGERRKLPQRGLRRNPRKRRVFERFREHSSTDISSTTLRLQTFRPQTFRLILYTRVYKTVIHPTSVSENHYFHQYFYLHYDLSIPLPLTL